MLMRAGPYRTCTPQRPTHLHARADDGGDDEGALGRRVVLRQLEGGLGALRGQEDSEQRKQRGWLRSFRSSAVSTLS